MFKFQHLSWTLEKYFAWNKGSISCSIVASHVKFHTACVTKRDSCSERDLTYMSASQYCTEVSFRKLKPFFNKSQAEVNLRIPCALYASWRFLIPSFPSCGTPHQCLTFGVKWSLNYCNIYKCAYDELCVSLNWHIIIKYIDMFEKNLFNLRRYTVAKKI